MSLYDAYVLMFSWVTGKTTRGSPGYVPVLVSHSGFGFHFEILQRELLRESKAMGLQCPEEALDVPAEWRFLDTLMIAQASRMGWPLKRGKRLDKLGTCFPTET